MWSMECGPISESVCQVFHHILLNRMGKYISVRWTCTFLIKKQDNYQPQTKVLPERLRRFARCPPICLIDISL